MAGSVLGADQVTKINASYPRLLRHVRELVSADSSAYGLMKVHFLTEFLDTTELASIFTELSFLAPAEKRALVRAAIYDVLVTNTIGLFVPGLRPSEAPVVDLDKVMEKAPSVVESKAFTPPQFNLNVNTAASFKPKEV